MSLFARTKRFTWKMKETANSIQRTCSTHLPSIKSWFIPVLLRTLCIMWQCTTVQWSGLHFVTLGGRGDSVRGRGEGGSSSLKLLGRGVFWFLTYKDDLLFFPELKKKQTHGIPFVVCFFFYYLDLSTVMDVPLTSASHCCELLMFWMDVRESQLIWRRKSVIGWGKKKIQASVKNKRNGSRTTMLFRLFYFFYLNVGIPFITTFWVFSVNNVSCWLSCLQWGHTGNMDVLKALWQTVAV